MMASYLSSYPTPLVYLMLWVCVICFQPSYSQPADSKYLLGQFDPKTNSKFIKLEGTYTNEAAKGKYLRIETYQAFVKMAKAAQQQGIRLVIISATRNFEAQKVIWENKWEGRTKVEGKDLTTVLDKNQRARLILLYSSMPGTSRHHWGTDIDLNSLEDSYFQTGEGLKVYQWLQSNAAKFGFCQPYTAKTSGRLGYEEEKWHWSYLPLSSKLVADYVSKITYKDIANFKGSEVASQVKVIEEYVQGVGCK